MKDFSEYRRAATKPNLRLPATAVQVIIETKSMDVLPHRAGTDLGITLPMVEQEKTA
jgi:hypothetical protein